MKFRRLWIVMQFLITGSSGTVIAAAASLLVDGVTAKRIVWVATLLASAIGTGLVMGTQWWSTHVDEELLRKLMSPYSAGMTLTPAAAKELSRGELRIEALRRLKMLENPTPGQLRVIAELSEFVDGSAVARQWWEMAAAAGDEDAVEYLEVLVEEESGDR